MIFEIKKAAVIKSYSSFFYKKIFFETIQLSFSELFEYFLKHKK